MAVKKNVRASRKLARERILQALYQWQLSDAPDNELIAQYRVDHADEVIDWPFFEQAIRTITSTSKELDEQYVSFLDRTIEQLDPIERGVLRLGIFELMHRVDVPYRVVINEAVELAKRYGATESHKYINGILDKAARQLREVEISGQAR
ncbi:MAG: transcription antitermination factor NusB [Pseudomonadota bacterium]